MAEYNGLDSIQYMWYQCHMGGYIFKQFNSLHRMMIYMWLTYTYKTGSATDIACYVMIYKKNQKSIDFVITHVSCAHDHQHKQAIEGNCI